MRFLKSIGAAFLALVLAVPALAQGIGGNGGGIGGNTGGGGGGGGSGCPVTGCTFSGPVSFGSNAVSGSNFIITGGSLGGAISGNPTFSGTGTFSASGTAFNVSNNAAIGGSETVGSVLVGSATGGNQGAGTVNATGLFVNGVSVSSQVDPNFANSGVLPVVTSANSGQRAFVLNCLNGTESGGGGTGCSYEVDNTGAWRPQPFLVTQTLTVGGQALHLGASTTNQGTGGKLQLSTGTATSGHCVQFDATGNTVDAGGACTVGGGGGTVSSGTINQLAWYSSTGTAVAGLSTANSGVLITSGAGVPSISTTLPASLSAATMSLSSPAMTGTATYAAMTGSGKLTTTASATGASGLNLPPGTAPTSPNNGDIWVTSSALQARVNGSTVTLGASSGTVSSIVFSSPLSGGTITTTGTVGCAVCVTSTNGGAMTATAPLAYNSTTNVFSLGNQTNYALFDFDSQTPVHNDTYYIAMGWPWATGSISSVSYLTGGSGSPTFQIALTVNGTNVTTCNGITVQFGTTHTTNCGSNSITSGQPVTLVVSGTTGTPSSAAIQVNYVRSAS